MDARKLNERDKSVDTSSDRPESDERDVATVEDPRDQRLNEKDDSAPFEPRPFTHGWRDPRIAQMRGMYLKIIGSGTMLTVVVILAVLSIYWGAFWRVRHNVSKLNVIVADLDGAAIGQAVAAGLTSPLATGAAGQVSFQLAQAGQFASPEDVERYIRDEHAWAAVFVPQGATQRLQSALSAADASYNSSNAIGVFIATGRNENATPTLISPQLQAALTRISAAFAEQQAKTLASNSSANIAALLGTAPALVTRPVWFNTVDLHPFDVPVAAAVDFVGLIYLLVISFLLSMLNYNARLISRLDTLLTLRSLIVLRIVAPLCMYFVLSWFYCFISLAFQVPFSRFYGHGGFLIYWAISFLGMCALGLALEMMLLVLTPRFVPYFLILWIISNVSVAFYPIAVLPTIFRYGYAMPFYNVGQTVRTILFNAKSHLGQNFGIMIAWVALSCLTIPTATIILRRRDMNAARNK